MKIIYCVLLLFICFSSFSQSGTIKIEKPPPPKKDTVSQKGRAVVAAVGSNYTFREIGKFGFEAEVLVGFRSNHYFLGLRYTRENEFYSLYPYNKQTLLPEPGYSRSETKSDYLKMPFGYSGVVSNANVLFNGNGRLNFGLSIVPEYLLKTSNQYGRLSISDFSRFNLSGSATIAIPIFSDDIFLSLTYSRDFLNNLKDKNIYNEQGTVIAQQRSKTDLLTVALHCRLFVEKGK